MPVHKWTPNISSQTCFPFSSIQNFDGWPIPLTQLPKAEPWESSWIPPAFCRYVLHSPPLSSPLHTHTHTRLPNTRPYLSLAIQSLFAHLCSRSGINLTFPESSKTFRRWANQAQRTHKFFDKLLLKVQLQTSFISKACGLAIKQTKTPFKRHLVGDLWAS